jgi:hypothetical protein
MKSEEAVKNAFKKIQKVRYLAVRCLGLLGNPKIRSPRNSPLVNNFNSELGEAIDQNSASTAVRSREGDAGDGPRFRRQRLFWLLFWSQKSDKWLFGKILSLECEARNLLSLSRQAESLREHKAGQRPVITRPVVFAGCMPAISVYPHIRSLSQPYRLNRSEAP